MSFYGRPAAVGVLLLTAGAASGQTMALRGRSAFDGVARTLIDFETRGDGTPYDVAEGVVFTLDPSQYAHFGFTVFAPDPLIANDPSPDVEFALAEVGSLEHSIFLRGSLVGFLFEDPGIHSVGISVIRNVDNLTGPLILQARDWNANLIAQFVYDASFLQGQVGSIDFGFIGVTSDVPIRNFLFVVQGSDFIEYDDLIFSTVMVPAPGGVVLVGFGVLGVRRRAR